MIFSSKQPVDTESTNQKIERIISDQLRGARISGCRLEWLNGAIQERFGETFTSFSNEERLRHGKDMSAVSDWEPDLIFYPENANQLSWLLKLLSEREERIAVIPFGKGTSYEGQVIGCKDVPCISIDLQRMNKIYHTCEDCVRVETGLDKLSLNSILYKDGLWFPIETMSNSTIGGMIGTNAVGLDYLRYGTTRSNVISIKAVLADGRIITMNEQCLGLMDLFIGSEGMLGVIVEATLKVKKIDEDLKTEVLSYSRMEEAALALPVIMRNEHVTRCVLLDRKAVAAVDKEHNISYRGYPTVLVQHDADYQLALDRGQIIRTEDISTWDGQMIIWSKLGASWFAYAHPIPSTAKIPVLKVAEFIREMETTQVNFSIICNGEYVTFIVDGSENIVTFRDQMFSLALNMEGSCMASGIGLQKGQWAERELREADAVWKAIKHTLDPRGLFKSSL